MDEATALVPLLSAAVQDKEQHEELGEVGEDDTKWDQERERRMNIETNLAKLEELGLSPAVCTWRKRKRVQPLKPRVRAQHHPVRVSCNRGRSSEFTIKHHSKGRGMTQVGEEEEDEDDFRISNCGPAIYKREEYTKLDLAKLGSCKTEYPDLFFEKDYGGPTKEGCTICHQCRQKTKDQKTKCSLCSDRSMKGQFCAICLQIRYGENLNEVMDNPDWICPVCRDICNCSFCRMKKGWAPTGVLGPYAMKIKGYPSVAHYLIHSFQKDKLRAEETDEEEEDDVSSSDNEDNKRDSDYADEKGEEEEEVKVEWEFRKEVEQERRAQKSVKDHHRRDEDEEEEEEEEDEEEEVEDDGSDYVDEGDEDVEEDEDEDDDEDEEGEDDRGRGRKRLRRSNRRVPTNAKNSGGQASGVVVPKKEEGGDEVDRKEGQADKEEKKDNKEEKEEKEESGVVVDDGGGGGGDDDKDILPGEKDMKKTAKPPKKRQRTSSGQPPTTGSGSNKSKNAAKKKNKKDKEATTPTATTTTPSNSNHNNNNHNKKTSSKKHEGKKSSDKAKEIKYNKGQLVCCWADPAYGDEQRFWIGKVRQTSYKHARKVNVQWFEKQPDGLYLLTSELDSIPAASIFRTNFEPKFVAISKRKWRLDEDLTPSGVDWTNYH